MQTSVASINLDGCEWPKPFPTAEKEKNPNGMGLSLARLDGWESVGLFLMLLQKKP